MTWQGHVKDGSAPLMNTESLKRHFQSPQSLYGTHEHSMGLTRQEQILAQGLHQWHEGMQSPNGTDYGPAKPSRQSRQSYQYTGHHPFNASGTSLHHQQNMHNTISGDFSVGFLDDFHMDYNHPENGVSFMTSHQDPLALVPTMAEWQESLTFDPTITGWQDPMACDSTMGAWQDSSIDSSRSSSVSANSGPSAKDDGTQESFICSDECCQGRAFSSRANLRRHQNERKGLRRVYACSFCHRVFSRSTACRSHQQNGVCLKSNGWEWRTTLTSHKAVYNIEHTA